MLPASVILLTEADLHCDCLQGDPTRLWLSDFVQSCEQAKAWLTAYMVAFLTPDGKSFVPVKCRTDRAHVVVPLSELPIYIKTINIRTQRD